MKKTKISCDIETLLPILIGAWRRMHKLPGPQDKLQTREFRSVVSAIGTLNRGFAAEGTSLHAKDYFQDKELLGAYLLYSWILHYQEGLSLLGELPRAPKRALDLCSGPGAFALAALKYGAEVVAIDQSNAALSLGAEVCGRYGLPLTVRTANVLKGRLPVEGRFDLIMLGHCLEELFPLKKAGEEASLLFLRRLIEHHLSSDGYILLVESSQPESNSRFLRLRDALADQGIPIQAPCIWQGKCPALQANSPCYAQREFDKPYLVKEIQRAASINLGSLKMSYLILRHPAAGLPLLEDKKLYRVISPPIDSFNGKRFYLCGTDGKKQLSSHLNTHPVESRAFEYLRRGELISIKGALEKSHALDIIQDTLVQVEAACGKPLAERAT